MSNLPTNEEYEKSVCECNGYKFHPRPFTCPDCGSINDCDFTWCEGNRGIKQRCKCGKWVGFVKYDPRSKSEKIIDRIYKQ